MAVIWSRYFQHQCMLVLLEAHALLFSLFVMCSSQLCIETRQP